MKRSPGKILAFLLAFVLMVPVLGNQNATVASGAASPAFSKSKVTITGVEKTYQSVIKNKIAKSTYKWTTSNKKIANVSSKGVVTSVDKGTATIKCKITYPTKKTKKTKTISYKVTVKVPATAITINNANDTATGAHLLTIGDSYVFKVDTVPANTSDIVYWTVGGKDPSCVRLEDPLTGKVTALESGYAILTATAAKSTKAADLAKGIRSDAVIIRVAEPSVNIISADFASSTEIKVVFDKEMDKTTLIDSTDKLSSNIDIKTQTVGKVSAKDPGNLTAVLSSDNKTLTITASKYFSGYYQIIFSNNIKSISGLKIDSDVRTINYIDTTPPILAGVSLDTEDTGMLMTITFSEPIDFSDLKIKNALPVPSTASYDVTTKVYLENKLNYMISEDQKSLTIDMSKLVWSDQNRPFQVTLFGIKDMAGHKAYEAVGNMINVVLQSNNAPKAQAKLINARRSSYYTISVLFNRSITDGGWLDINGDILIGTVDENNKRMVNYTLSETQAKMTGGKTVYIGHWNSYNVSPSDTSADTMHPVNINFSVDSTRPVLSSTYEFDVENNILTLHFNEDVTLASNEGWVSYRFNSRDNDIYTGVITYKKLESTDSKTIRLRLDNVSIIGSYAITFEEGFALDGFKNASIKSIITFSNSSNDSDSNSNALPDPISITQSTEDLSEIYVQFSKKLDEASAETISNYTIPEATIISARLYLNGPNGATVILTVADGSIKETLEKPVIITGVKGYKGSYDPIDCVVYVPLKENVRPKVISAPAFDRKTLSTIKMTFDEPVQGNLIVNISQQNNSSISYSGSAAISDDKKTVIIMLDRVPTINTVLRVDILVNTVTDINGNKAVLSSPYMVQVVY